LFSKNDKDKEKILSFFKALNLMLTTKGETFKDLHDFYFLEQDFYNGLVDD
jgi:hypothetical protein